MKSASLLLLLASCFFLLSSALANPGVVIEAKGKVVITEGGKKITAQSGTKFNDGSTIAVENNGRATLMLNNGSIRKLAGGERYTAEKSAPGSSPGKPMIKGLAMAYNDAMSGSRGPVVHGMVKEAMPGTAAGTAGGDKKLDPSLAKRMKADLNQINTLGLGTEGRAIMQAQVYYKYGQNQKAVDTILPVYRSQHPPSDMVKSILVVANEKMGKLDEAAKYK